MGLFSAIHDTAVSIDVVNAAKEINRIQQQMMPILNNIDTNGGMVSSYQKDQLCGYLNAMEAQLINMQTKMNKISANNQILTMVPCLDGHMTAAPGYMMTIRMIIDGMRNDLKKC